MLGYCQLNPYEQTSIKCSFKYKTFHSRKCIWKYRLPKLLPFCPAGRLVKYTGTHSPKTRNLPHFATAVSTNYDYFFPGVRAPLKLVLKIMWSPNKVWKVSTSCLFGMMTSSNGNIFRVTGPLCGEFTGPGEYPTQRPVTRSIDVFFDLRLNKRLSKQPRGWWFETLSCPLWRQFNASWLFGYSLPWLNADLSPARHHRMICNDDFSLNSNCFIKKCPPHRCKIHVKDE